jgi:hypothetical protein
MYAAKPVTSWIMRLLSYSNGKENNEKGHNFQHVSEKWP